MLERLEESAKRILNAGLLASHAGRLIEKDLRLQGDILYFRDYKVNLKKHDKIVVIGAGKATWAMAEAMEKILGDRIDKGLIITKCQGSKQLKYIEVLEGSHPIVSKRSLDASAKMLKLLKNLTSRHFVIVLVSGGASALLEKFPPGVTLKDAQKLNDMLLKSGLTIKQINKVRRNISLLKNGGLGKILAPAKVMSLVLSDVISDRLDLVASGPTIPGNTNPREAINILKYNRIWSKTPKKIRDYLLAQSEKNPKSFTDSAKFRHITNILLGSNNDLLVAAREKAMEEGYNTIILTSQAQGEAKDVASLVSSIVNEVVQFDRPVKKPACLIIGGETTVTVIGDGIGGRNLEFALSSAIHVRHQNHNILIASLGTDGNDGPTPVAGAMITQYTFDKAMSLQLNPRDFLMRNDSYSFFEQVGGLLNTGPTGTNVMDIMIALIQ
jgi:glycerate-2-kinase